MAGMLVRGRLLKLSSSVLRFRPKTTYVVL